MTKRPHMRRVKSKNTSPELTLRRVLWGMGFRGYRFHRKGLPGKPDVCFGPRKKAIFLHGCFWHGHDCRAGRNVPRTNQEYWGPKLARNRERDERHNQELADMGWSVLVVWECELKDPDALADKLRAFMCA